MKDKSIKRLWPFMSYVVCSAFDYRFNTSPSITVLELVTLAVLFQIFLDRVALGNKFDVQILSAFYHTKEVMLYFFWLVLCGVIAIAWRGNALNFWLARDFFPSCIMLLIIYVYRIDFNDLKRLIWVYILCSFVIALIGHMQIFTGHPEIVPHNWAFDDKMGVDGNIISSVNKPSGFFWHPNALASYFIAPIALILMSVKSGWLVSRTKILLLIGLVFILPVLFGTYAKGGWAWVAISSLLILLTPKSLRSRPQYICIGIVIYTVVMLLLSLYLYSEGFRSFATLITRMNLWLASWHILTTDTYVLVFGNGQLAMPQVSWLFSDIVYPNAHSGLVNIPLFYGVPGAILFFIVIYRAYRLAKAAMVKPELMDFGFTLIVLLVVYVCNALYEPHLEGGGMLGQFYMIISLCHCLNYISREDK